MYRIRFKGQFKNNYYFTTLEKLRNRAIMGVNISDESHWKCVKLKTANKMLQTIKEFHKDCARMNGTKDISELYEIEEY
jgi:hypothetical protein